MQVVIKMKVSFLHLEKMKQSFTFKDRMVKVIYFTVLLLTLPSKQDTQLYNLIFLFFIFSLEYCI